MNIRSSLFVEHNTFRMGSFTGSPAIMVFEDGAAGQARKEE